MKNLLIATTLALLTLAAEAGVKTTGSPSIIAMLRPHTEACSSLIVERLRAAGEQPTNARITINGTSRVIGADTTMVTITTVRFDSNGRKDRKATCMASIEGVGTAVVEAGSNIDTWENGEWSSVPSDR